VWPHPAKPATFNILLVGSDSRQFVDNSGEAGSFGSAAAVADNAATHHHCEDRAGKHQIKLLSIPRDTYVDIPGNVNGSPDRTGSTPHTTKPSLLVDTITNSFHIPITYYAEVNFPVSKEWSTPLAVSGSIFAIR